MKNRFLLFVAIFVTNLSLSWGQNASDYSAAFQVVPVHPPASLSATTIDTARTLADLDRYYRPAWVNTYLNVKVSGWKNGQQMSVDSENDLLTAAQKSLLQSVDNGREVKVEVNYIPENNLRDNTPKVLHFNFTIQPDHTASFPGGSPALHQYLLQRGLAEVPVTRMDPQVLAAVTFTVAASGEVIAPIVAQSAQDATIDQLLLRAVRQMPCWEPAQFADGQKVAQDFVLTVGNQASCLINVLGIQRE
ncbi:MAG: energy transducer TonB [Bacteroidota bacterium]